MNGRWKFLISIVLLGIVLLCGCTGTQNTAAKDIAKAPVGTPYPAFTIITPDPELSTKVTTVVTTSTTTSCIPDWSCSNWSACSTSNLQVRTCIDQNVCGFLSCRPVLSQQCTYIPTLPPPGPYAISITGDPVCRQTAENAVNNLKYRASPDYEYFRKFVGAINCTYSDVCYTTGFRQGETRFYTVCIASLLSPPTVFIDEPFWRADPVWLAGVLVHEACHSEGYQEYILKEGADYDLTEFSDWKFERRCCDRMRTTWNQLGAPAYTYDLYRSCSL